MMEYNDNLEQLLQLAKREDLILFSLDYAKDNASFKKDLQSFLGNKYLLNNKNTSKDYARQMAKAFDETTDIGNRWHSFEIPDWAAIFSKALKVISEGKKLLDIGNANAAAMIAVEFFKQFSDNFDENTLFDDYENSDDGGYECEQAEKLLLNAIDHPYISKDVQKSLIGELGKLSNSDFSKVMREYDIFDFDNMLLNVNLKTKTSEDSLKLLDAQIEQHRHHYDLHTYVERKIDLLNQMGKSKEAKKVESQYIFLSEIRRNVLNRLIEQKKYKEAIECAEDGIKEEQATDTHAYINDWIKYLANIYKATGDTGKQISTCRQLFINNHGSKEYYHQLKKIVPAAEWKNFLDCLINDAKLDGRPIFGSSILADIYVEEKDRERLYQLIKKEKFIELDTLNNYARYTGQEHAAEFLDIYVQKLKADAKNNVNAKAYARIANAMEYMRKLKGGQQVTHQLAVFFREQYRRRPSMMTAISKF
jgi:hypothetical protein